MKKYLKMLGPVLIGLIFCLAIYLLYIKLKQYSVAQIQECIGQVASWRIVVCLLGTALSYGILVGYDWLAIKAIHKELAFQRVCLVSFIGQTVSYNFGALLGGTTVRYRFYSAWDFSLSDIVRLVLMLAVTFWIGVLGLCGIFFVCAPPHIPDELVSHIPFADLRILGAILFVIAFCYMVLCFRIRHPIHIFGKEFVFPTPKIAVAQLIVAGLDILAAAFCMYILLPSSLGISFWDFVPSYLLAQVAVVLTHVPGGVGIFELIIIHLTQTDQTQVVFAAVLLFRLFYYILPLLLAALIFAAYEIKIRRNFLYETSRWLRVLSHSIAAYLAFGLGVFFVVTSFLPLPPETGFWSGVSALGQYLLVLSGSALVILAQGLEGRRMKAHRLALFCTLLGAIAQLLHGFSFVCALIAVLLLAFLF